MITKQNAAQWLPLVRAMAEGKTVQIRVPMPDGAKWLDAKGVSPEKYQIDEYRIKPEARWRAWKPEEVPKMMIVMSKTAPTYFIVCKGTMVGAACRYDLEELLKRFVRIAEDGSEHPCGVLCEGEEHGEG